MIFSFGQSQNERLEIDVLSYERASVGEYWDDNWLIVEIRIQVGGFRGKVRASFQAAELESFSDELKELHRTLRGTAKFETLEEQLSLELNGDGKSHTPVEGILLDSAGSGNRLHFMLAVDQTQLGLTIQELDAVLGAFPVRLQK